MPSSPLLEGEGYGGGVQDVFVAAAQFKAIGGGSSPAAKVALAAIAGLVLVGLVLLGVSLASRRMAGSAPNRTVKGKEPAGVS